MREVSLQQSPWRRCEYINKISYAIGGNERSLKVYDVSTGKQRWKSKNVPNDFLSLRVPIYIGSSCFEGRTSCTDGYGTWTDSNV